MSKKQEQTQPGSTAEPQADFVWYNNLCKGLLVLPVVGHLKPGWNKVSRAVHLATKRADGGSIIPADAPVQVRDDSAGLTKNLTTPAAVATVLETNQVELLDEVLMEDKRPIVRTAAEHQKKVIKLEDVPREDLKRMADVEAKVTSEAGIKARGEVIAAVAKAETLKAD